MKFYKSFKHALNMVLHSKIRSWLTILGIVIGVAAVVAITSLGQSLQQDINSQLGALGGDLVTIRAGASRASGFFGGGGREGQVGGITSSASKEEIVLDKTDVQALRGVEDIKLIETEISGRADVYYVAEKGSITGVDQKVWFQITTSKIKDGRMLGPADTNVIVVGGRFASSFFTTQVGINQMVTIGSRLFRIVGILDDESSSIYMPIDSAYETLEDKTKGVYDSIIIKVKNEDELDTAVEHINEKLRISRHVTAAKPDFSLTSNKERQQQREQITSSMTSFLTAIAAVALLVGAVGIANTMFTSVLEKTKEIGIMKAIGARNADILAIFLLNAALIGFIGGVLGIIFGILLSGFLPSLMGGSAGPLSRLSGGVISIQTVFIALFISIMIGVISGVVPAYQASRLRPVDALRFE